MKPKRQIKADQRKRAMAFLVQNMGHNIWVELDGLVMVGRLTFAMNGRSCRQFALTVSGIPRLFCLKQVVKLCRAERKFGIFFPGLVLEKI